jgi:predicted nucleic acid-binding protein
MKSAFLDTNILVYAVDPRDPRKRDAALDIIRSLSSGWSLSVQVLQEFYWASIRKLSISPSDARATTELWSRQRVVQPTPQLVIGAIDTSERYRVSFWDALIVEAAVAGQCDVLYTEDLSHGQVIRGVTVANPF